MRSNIKEKIPVKEYMDDSDLITAFTARKTGEQLIDQDIQEIIEQSDSETSDEELLTLILELQEVADGYTDEIFDLDDITLH